MQEEKKESKEEKPSKKKHSKWRKTLSTILTIIVVLVIVFSVLLFVQTKMAKKPFLFGYATYIVISGSMEPTIHVGEVIIVEKVDSIKDLKEGDVVTYAGKEGEFAGKTVTHRIRRIEGDKIVTRGDSTMNIKDDPAITFNDVIGRYVKTSGFLSSIYSAFSNKYGFLLIVIIPLLILLFVQVVNFRRACKMDDDGKMPDEKSAEQEKEKAVKEKEAEIKRKAIEEYIASKKRVEKAQKDKKDNS